MVGWNLFKVVLTDGLADAYNPHHIAAAVSPAPSFACDAAFWLSGISFRTGSKAISQ
jgi:hypothetical protein